MSDYLTRILVATLLCFSTYAHALFDYELYEGDFTAMPDFSTLTAVETGQSNHISLFYSNTEDNFALVFSNTLTVSTAATYEFQVISDDGAKLYIDDQVIIDHDGVHPLTKKTGSVSLTAGTHSFRLEYFERIGGQGLDVQYNFPGDQASPIPADGVLNGAIRTVKALGEWGPVITWPHVAISAANLSDGRVLTWSSTETDAFPANANFTHAAIFDPSDNSFTNIDNNFHDMFCAGLSMLEDGTIIASGGNPYDNRVSKFDPETLTWSALPDMFDSRWYGTNVTLPNNQVFSSFGRQAGNRSEKYDPRLNQWIRTPNASMQTLLDEHNVQIDGGDSQWWAHLTVQPDGKVFHSGPGQTMHVFDPMTGGETLSLGKPTGERFRMWGHAVNYDAGKVLVLAGSDMTKNPITATSNVYIADLNGPTPVITSGTDMHYPRALSNAITMPNGEILVIGGNRDGVGFSDETAVYPSEIYTPSTDSWRLVDKVDVPRTYHSTATLLKDGRVLSSGGGACGACDANHLDGQIYSPPYLFNQDGSAATRPTLSGVPADALIGSNITVTASADTERFSMIRLAAHTHHINTDHRFLPISSQDLGNGSFELTLEANPNVLIAGYYWIFALNADGTPSIGQAIKITRDLVDTDGDGVNDDQDAFPYDPFESVDTDGDGVGDNTDAFPNDASETLDSDGDGTGNNADTTPFGDPVVMSLPDAPRQSSTLIVENSTGQDRIWNVNPDNNSVSVSSADGNLIQEISVGNKPWSLAKAPGRNQVFVTNKQSGTLSVINTATLSVAYTIGLNSTGQPHGIVFNSAGTSYYVVYEAAVEIEKRSTLLHTVEGTLALTGHPRHVSILYDDSRLLVSNYITLPLPGESTDNVDINNGYGELYVVDPQEMTLSNVIVLPFDERTVSESRGPGLPNYLNAAAISFDNSIAYVPSKKDNINAGGLRGNIGITFDQTVRANTSKIDLSTETVQGTAIDFDNASLATGAAFTGDNRYLLVALETSRELAVYDVNNRFELMRLPTGRAPQGVALSTDGSIAYVHNFMDRSISRFDLTQMIETQLPATNELASISVVTQETLSDQILLGKQLFYDAADDRIARDNYLSCAACHNEGGHDGRVWDFTSLGEGVRNTTSLIGRGGTSHGLLHWSGNFDEVQDFEAQIRQLGGGTGLMSNEDFNSGTRSEPLGDPKAGLSEDLDALAAYVNSLSTFAPSPYREEVALTAEAQQGKQLFIQKQCAECHGGARYTRSSTESAFANIGTINAFSGTRLDEPITGIDVPTLRDVWDTAPYFHNGSAQTLLDAIYGHEPGMDPGEATLLAHYLSQIGNGEGDGIEPDGNSLPSITLNDPVGTEGNTSGSIEAVASDDDGSITKIEFYYDTFNLVGTVEQAPYVLTWSGVANGTYPLTAKAYDDQGGVTTSNIVQVVVDDSQNIAPTVSIEQAEGSTGNVSGSILATASDQDGTIAKVEFYYNGNNLLATDEAAPFEVNWNTAPDGTYNLTAIAYDSAGATTTSNELTITVDSSLE